MGKDKPIKVLINDSTLVNLDKAVKVQHCQQYTFIGNKLNGEMEVDSRISLPVQNEGKQVQTKQIAVAKQDTDPIRDVTMNLPCESYSPKSSFETLVENSYIGSIYEEDNYTSYTCWPEHSKNGNSNFNFSRL